MSTYRALLDQILRDLRENDKVEVVLLIGSRARKEQPDDAYADLNLILSVKDPDFFLYTDQWLLKIGNARISFVQDTFCELKERRVLFDGGIDVDLVILPEANRVSFLRHPDAVSILQQGYRVLLDKSGSFERGIKRLPEQNISVFPSEQEFLNGVKDFWYHLVWAMKKLQRGELWASIVCLDRNMQQKLLWIIECCMHIRKGKEYNTWYGGRFLDFWVDPDIREDLGRCFSQYSSADMLRALTEITVLFRRLAKEAAQALGFPYPEAEDQYATELVRASMQHYHNTSAQAQVDDLAQNGGESHESPMH